MKSQEYWGLGFIIVGVILLFLFPPETLLGFIYGIPLIIIGIIIIIFRNRESKIDK